MTENIEDKFEFGLGDIIEDDFTRGLIRGRLYDVDEELCFYYVRWDLPKGTDENLAEESKLRDMEVVDNRDPTTFWP